MMGWSLPVSAVRLLFIERGTWAHTDIIHVILFNMLKNNTGGLGIFGVTHTRLSGPLRAQAGGWDAVLPVQVALIQSTTLHLITVNMTYVVLCETSLPKARSLNTLGEVTYIHLRVPEVV